MPDAFLTGGTGFIGGALLRRLLADGRSVRALVRSEEGAAAVAAVGAEPVRGDVMDVSAWEDRLRDCRTLFHLAGYVSMCRRGVDRTHVEGTREVVAAAARAGVGKVVHTSSAATIGEGHGEIGNEETVHSGKYLSGYARSKHLAEQAAFSEATEKGIDLVAVNPTSVQGPGRTGGTARLFIDYLNGRLRWAVRTDVSLVSIGDTVEAHLLAESGGRPGERYLISGWTVPVEGLVATLDQVAGVETRVRYLPGWVFSALGTFAGWGYRLAGRRPRVCRQSARTVRHGHRFDGSRATRDLGLRYTPPEVWLAETVEWYREQGVV